MRVLLDITCTFSEKIDLILRGCDNYVQITHLIKKPGAFWQNNRLLENFRDQNHNWLLAKKIGKLAKKAENVLDIIGGFGGKGYLGLKIRKHARYYRFILKKKKKRRRAWTLGRFGSILP